MPDWFLIVLQVAGLVAVTAGVWLWTMPGGLVVGGASLFAIGTLGQPDGSS